MLYYITKFFLKLIILYPKLIIYTYIIYYTLYYSLKSYYLFNYIKINNIENIEKKDEENDNFIIL